MYKSLCYIARKKQLKISCPIILVLNACFVLIIQVLPGSNLDLLYYSQVLRPYFEMHISQNKNYCRWWKKLWNTILINFLSTWMYDTSVLSLKIIAEYSWITFFTYWYHTLCQYTGRCYLPVHTYYLFIPLNQGDTIKKDKFYVISKITMKHSYMYIKLDNWPS